VNWSDPNFVSLFGAWGQWAGAFGSFAAVIVAIWIALRSSKVSQKQSLQASYNAARPVLVVSEGPFDSSDQQLGHEKFLELAFRAANLAGLIGM
jgi:hypothetical protein